MFFYNTQKRYNQLSEFLKNEFKTKVYKVTLDAGFSCPNRDGAVSYDGCIFCDSSGSFSQAHSSSLSLKEQLYTGIENLKTRFKAEKFISYLQAFSNTYKPVEELKAIYDSALSHPDVAGLSVGTRPDCVDEEKLDLISSYTKNYRVWIEYGLQSVHDKTLRFINRGHDYESFEKAVIMTKNREIDTCAHVILGLPGETKNEMLEAAKKIGDLGVNGVKIHALCVLQDTKLADLYSKNSVSLMEEDEYVDLVCDFLELLPPDVVIHRLAGNGLSSILVAPDWLSKKFSVLNKIDKELEKRNSYQGFKAALPKKIH